MQKFPMGLKKQESLLQHLRPNERIHEKARKILTWHMFQSKPSRSSHLTCLLPYFLEQTGKGHPSYQLIATCLESSHSHFPVRSTSYTYSYPLCTTFYFVLCVLLRPVEFCNCFTWDVHNNWIEGNTFRQPCWVAHCEFETTKNGSGSAHSLDAASFSVSWTIRTP